MDLGNPGLLLTSLARRVFRDDFWVRNAFTYLSAKKFPNPDWVVIEPVNACNLRCALCPTGQGRLAYKKTMMSPDVFREVIDKMPFIKNICLFNWGEPFLNPEIFKFIRYAKGKNINVVIHSNFCLRKNEKFFKDIVASGLDELVVSMDGAAQETYSKYRVGGDFNLVISNLKKAVQMRKRLKSDRPRIVWKFIVNRFNEHEIEKARDMAQSIGVMFQIAKMGLSDDLPDICWDANLKKRKDYWLPLNKEHVLPGYLKSCFNHNFNCRQLFETIVVNSDGKVFPCCYLTNENNTFGDLLSESFDDIWCGKKYRQARKLWLLRHLPLLVVGRILHKGVHVPCSKCFWGL